MGEVGTLALVGGAEWNDFCSFDKGLLEIASTDEVVVIPTAAAYEYPDRAVEHATKYFVRLGAKVRGLDLLTRPDAFMGAIVESIERARFLYLSGGSPLHLRSVLKNTPAYQAIVTAYQNGAVLAASSAGAMVLSDPMADPRGGALTVGLGLLRNMAIVPHFDTYPKEREQRTIALATDGVIMAGISEQTALIRGSSGKWRVDGAGEVVVFGNGEQIAIDEIEQRISIRLNGMEPS
ncbi:MAG: cyanophycinase [Acidimicrobiales bacterium]